MEPEHSSHIEKKPAENFDSVALPRSFLYMRESFVITPAMIEHLREIVLSPTWPPAENGAKNKDGPAPRHSLD